MEEDSGSLNFFESSMILFMLPQIAPLLPQGDLGGREEGWNMEPPDRERRQWSEESSFKQIRAAVNADTEALALRTLAQQKRSSNNLFKTPLSEFRKAITDTLKTMTNNRNRNLKVLKRKLNEIHSVKNYATFPKLLYFVRQMDLVETVYNNWEKRVEQLLRKKSELVPHSYQAKKLAQMKKIITRMNEAITETNIMNAFEKYWGQYRHSEKFQQSRRDVMSFVEQFGAVNLPKPFSYPSKQSVRSRVRGKKASNKRTSKLIETKSQSRKNSQNQMSNEEHKNSQNE